jgi:hypothetical protein
VAMSASTGSLLSTHAAVRSTLSLDGASTDAVGTDDDRPVAMS